MLKPKISVCAVFDIGKTNKKLFLFDENYEIVFEKSIQLEETIDEDGDACEDLMQLNKWVLKVWNEVLKHDIFGIKAINFSTYGASFVYVNSLGHPILPLYNYLKPYPENLKKQFYDTYGGEEMFSVLTASPVLGSLNSGMQLYRLKYEKPEIYKEIRHSLHLPQYFHLLLTGKAYSDITGIGCHTNLWNFQTKNYHDWVEKEGIDKKLAPMSAVGYELSANGCAVGIGLHDSSSALIPYLISFDEPFILLSTGTWNICLNPFNESSLTFEELQQDCLCYLTFQNKPVKASRLFAGNTHEIKTKELAVQFSTEIDNYKNVDYNSELIRNQNTATYEAAYHSVVFDIVQDQIAAINLVINGLEPIRCIFVDGGFSKNPIFMNLLAQAFPNYEVLAASVAQASALGAALAIHESWNIKPIPENLIELKAYS